MEPDSRIFEDLNWSFVEGRLGGAASIHALACGSRAVLRRREIKDGGQLLRLALAYAVSGSGLRSTAAWGALALGVEMSDVALMKRLRGSGDFLAAVCAQLLRLITGESGASPRWQGMPVRLVDSSVFAGPGKAGGQLRLHANYDPALGTFNNFDLSAISKGESLVHTGIEAGAIYLADRNYAKTKDLRTLEETGAFYVTRTGIRSMRMLDVKTSNRLTGNDILSALGTQDQAEIEVDLIEAKVRKAQRGRLLKARLLILKASPAAHAREEARIRRSRSRHGVTPNRETVSLAGTVMIITNLPADIWPAAMIADLYRVRWQIELAFKSLKSVFRMREVPAKDPALARAWILANLAAALLTNLLASAIQRAVPPSNTRTGKPIPQHTPLQTAPVRTARHPRCHQHQPGQAPASHDNQRHPKSNA